MKRTLLKRKIRACYFRIGLLALAIFLLLVLARLGQAADTRIAFMSTRNEDNGEIFLVNSDGRRVRRLTKHLQYDAVPAWSPDGQKIAFMSFRDEHRFQGRGAIRGEIYVMNSDGTNPINLTQSPGRADGSPSWSPDGKQIAFHSTWDIWRMDADGANPHNLTNHDAGDGYPEWSPDGRQIVFTSDRDRNWEIYVINADGTNPINLTNHPAEDGRPDWSPDGLQIAFDSNRAGDWAKDRNDNWEVYVMNADGTSPINLTNHPAEDSRPDWSPDGLQIAFDSNRAGDWAKDRNDNWEVYVMNADGTSPINLTNHPKWDSQASWEPAPTLSVAPNGKLSTLWGKVKRAR